jgi:hypothetical protein
VTNLREQRARGKEVQLDLVAEVNQLRKADQDIAAGRERVERQKALVLHLESGGHDIESAVALLSTLQGALDAMLAHRTLLHHHIAQKQRQKAQLWKQPDSAASS